MSQVRTVVKKSVKKRGWSVKSGKARENSFKIGKKILFDEYFLNYSLVVIETPR